MIPTKKKPIEIVQDSEDRKEQVAFKTVVDDAIGKIEDALNGVHAVSYYKTEFEVTYFIERIRKEIMDYVPTANDIRDIQESDDNYNRVQEEKEEY